MVKAVCMFSGGLDSALAAKVIKKQGIDVRLVNFTTPFFSSRNAVLMAKRLHMPLKEIDVTEDYIRVLRNPKHGYGSHLNPCIDCKIFMLKQAKRYAKRIGAKFIVTGEVLGQRPMSQHLQALRLIEKESGLKGRLLRPLSAKMLDQVEAERKWVDREKLLGIQGRSRKDQIELAKEFKIKEYPSPAGGCLLTNEGYAAKARDLLRNGKVTRNDILLIKAGRHFRIGRSRIIVGRNQEDNNQLRKLRQPFDFLFEVPGKGSPLTILRGMKGREAISLAAALTVRYSDSKDLPTKVKYGKKLEKETLSNGIKDEEAKRFRIISS